PRARTVQARKPGTPPAETSRRRRTTARARAGRRGRPRPRAPRSLRDDLDPPVLGAAGLGLVARDRLRLAPALHADAGRVDALRDQVVPHCLRAPLGELLVVGVRADRLGVALDRRPPVWLVIPP